MFPRGDDMTHSMRCKPAPKIVRRTDVDILTRKFEKIDVPHQAVSLRSFGASGDTLRQSTQLDSRANADGLPPEARRAKGGGEDGIRTHDTAVNRITV
jgi:hypothetical protein